MKRTTQYTTLGLLAAFGTTALVPMAAMAGKDADRQANKNLMRNLGIGGGVIAGLGLLNHNNNLALLGAAGAALAGSQYEKARHNQSSEQSRDNSRYYRNGGGDYESYSGRDNSSSDSGYSSGDSGYGNTSYSDGSYQPNNSGSYGNESYRFSGPPRGRAFGSWRHLRQQNNR